MIIFQKVKGGEAKVCACVHDDDDEDDEEDDDDDLTYDLDYLIGVCSLILFEKENFL